MSLYTGNCEKTPILSNIDPDIDPNIDPNIDYLEFLASYKHVYINTTCGRFAIFKIDYKRLSLLLMKEFYDYKTQEIAHRGKDHDIYLFIHRYIRYGIKIDMNTVCARLGVSKEDGMKLLNGWGYDDRVCGKEEEWTSFG